jgi:hypothetical protein
VAVEGDGGITTAGSTALALTGAGVSGTGGAGDGVVALKISVGELGFATTTGSATISDCSDASRVAAGCKRALITSVLRRFVPDAG